MADGMSSSTGGSESLTAFVSSETIVDFGRIFGDLPLTCADALALNASGNAENVNASISLDAEHCVLRSIA
ncbi:MAG: hypothetical protein JO189_20705 [Deltaproteobacteria bacterium]|nr:hypothetical protein [Deltaproteobacteria bacterium]